MKPIISLKSTLVLCLCMWMTQYSLAGTYTWDAGGDGVSLFQEANWDGIPVINPNTDLLHNLVITFGTVGGGGFSGNLDLGGNNLLITGGTLTSSGSTGIRTSSSGSGTSTMDIQGGTVDVTYMVDLVITMSGSGGLTLTGGNNPLNNSTIDLDSAFTGQIYFENETVADFTSEHLSKITVGGSAAVIGVNLDATTSGSGCIVTVIASAGGGDFTWTGASDNDGFNENNWWDGVSNISTIDPNTELGDNLIINSGTPSFGGVLALAGHSLTMTGGTATLTSTNGIKSFDSGSVKSIIAMSGDAALEAQYVVNQSITMADSSTLTLNGGNNPLNTSTIDLAADFTGYIYFTDETTSDAASEHVGKITVDGETAIEGINVALTSDGGSGSYLTVSYDNPYEFDHTDTDGDGVPDTVEVNLGLNPSDDQSNLGERPNIIFILVDDLGFGDLGKFFQDDKTGQKFDTPHLDTLADEGAMLTHHYVSAPVCAPSRGSFLEGLHQGHSSIRNNQFDKEMPDEMNLATLLRSSGYYTAIVGKHGLAGGRSSSLDAHPLKRGFDEFFGYLYHQEGHEHYPRNGTTEKSANLHDGFSTISTNTDKVYTTDVFTARAKKIIQDRNTANPEQPFFLYLAYDVPHSKLQIPQVAYPSGYGVSGGVQWTGDTAAPYYVNTATGTIDTYYHPDYSGETWSDDDKRHVGMIRRVDYAIRDIVETLRDLGIDDNTMIVFTSDNGPHHEGGQDPRSFRSYADMDGTKRDMWEAGIRVPAIAWWPGTVPAGSTSTFPIGIWDWMNTFCDMANMPLPAWTDGESALPELQSPGSQTREENLYWEYQYNGTTQSYTDFEASRRGQRRYEMQAIRIGDYKGVRTDISGHSDDFEIYDVVNDAKETTDLAGTMTDLQQEMKDEVLRMRIANSSASRPYDGENIPAVSVSDSLINGLDYRGFTGHFLWVPKFDDLTPNGAGDVDTVDLSVRPSPTYFGLEYTGYLSVPTTGSYTFYLETDAAAHVKLHNIHLLNDDYKADHSEQSVTVDLEAGYHPIEIGYKHRDEGSYQLDVSISGPSISKQRIPNSMLFHPGTCSGLYAATSTDYYQLNPLTGAVLNTYPATANSLGWINGASSIYQQGSSLYWVSETIELQELDLNSGAQSSTATDISTLNSFWGMRYYDGYLYTMTRSGDNDKMLVRIDPSTGLLDAGFPGIEISGSAGVELSIGSTMVIDPVSGICYVNAYGNQLLAFDIGAGTGSVIGLSGYVSSPGMVELLQINEVTGQMYGLSGQTDIVSVDSTGAVALVKTLSSASGYSFPVSAFDSYNELFIFQAYTGCSANPLVTVNVNTGTEYCSNPSGLSFSQMQFMNCQPSPLLRTPVTSFDVDVYPNPVRDMLRVELEIANDGLVQLEIIGISGSNRMSRTYSMAPGASILQLDISDLESGLYILRIRSGSNEISSKIVKI